MKSLLSVTSINVNGTVYLKKKCFHLVHKVQILTGDTPQMEWSERDEKRCTRQMKAMRKQIESWY